MTCLIDDFDSLKAVRSYMKLPEESGGEGQRANHPHRLCTPDDKVLARTVQVCTRMPLFFLMLGRTDASPVITFCIFTRL